MSGPTNVFPCAFTNRTHFRQLLLCFCVLLASSEARPESPASDGPNNWAILIGVEEYKNVSNLKDTIQDVVKLKTVLTERGDFLPGNILIFVDGGNEDPTRDNIVEGIKDWLKKAKQGDRLLIYLTVHGCLDSTGQLYLCPKDFDPQTPSEAGIPVEWLRDQLRDCQATTKLLVLDACHSGQQGNDKDVKGGNSLRTPTWDQLTKAFTEEGPRKNVITLASSKGNQTSQIWDAMDQSVFSYWLCQGLRGAADKNDPRGEVTVQELMSFLPNKVESTVAVVFKDCRPVPEQTPTFLNEAAIEGNVEVLRLKTPDSQTALNQIADQFCAELILNKKQTVLIPPFQEKDNAGLVGPGNKFGTLTRTWARTLGDTIRDKLPPGRKMTVLDEVTWALLEEKKITYADLAKGIEIQPVNGQNQKVADWDAYVSGELSGLHCRPDGKYYATLRCELRDNTTAGAPVLASQEIQCVLTEYDLDLVTEKPPGDTFPLKKHWLYPSRIQESPVNVQILVEDTPRRFQFFDNDSQAFVKMQDGDVYEIQVTNQTDKLLFLRLLVDGYDTLPHRDSPPRVKGMVTVDKPVPSKLSKARPWVLDPQGEYVICGFFTKIGSDGECHAFKVVKNTPKNQQNHASALQRVSQLVVGEIGIITAAVYEAKPKSANNKGEGDLRTIPGTLMKQKVEEFTGDQEPNDIEGPIALIHIRYGTQVPKK